SQFTFTALEFFLQDIGGPPAGAGVSSGPNGLSLQAGNGDFAGTNDSFNFAYTLRRGDFDVKVRVSRVDFGGAWTVASLMAREDLGTNSRYAAVSTTPSVAGTFFQYRDTLGGPAAVAGSFPANPGYTWLRLQRVGGTLFNGFASFDGQ